MLGLVFEKDMNKELYRNAVVEAIFKLAPPDLLYDMSKVHGGDRICREVLIDKFKHHPPTTASVLGLYGMGGLGKTTISKCLCNHFNQEFLGRVCYIEMEDGKDALTRQNIVMRKLLRLAEPIIDNIEDASKGWGILKCRMKENPVFLVIDNVGPDEEAQDEALEYLNIEYNSQSKIMVVARSLNIVEKLLGDGGYSCEIPSLVMKEAVGILLQQRGQNLEYSSLSEDERGIAEGFVEEASWPRNGGGQYHPLALRAIGAYLWKKTKTPGVLSWATYRDEYRELKATGEPYNKLFKILGLQFSTLDKKKQLMYIDIVLYAPSSLVKYGLLSNTMFSDSGPEDMEMWLANIHNVRIAVVKEWISYFEEIALLNIEREKILVHDLYKIYAQRALENVEYNGELVGVWCNARSTEGATIPGELQKSPSGNCWQELKRIHLQHLSFQGCAVKKFQEWQNVVVLQIISCTKVITLNFQWLRCLHHLELRNLQDLQTLILTGDDESTFPRAISQASCVEPTECFPRPWLKYVGLYWLPSLEFLSSFGTFTSLKYLEVVGCRKLREPPRVQHCPISKQMHLDWYPEQKTLPNLDGLTSLQNLTIYAPGKEHQYQALKLEGLSSLSSLRVLELNSIPVGDVSGLENLTNVKSIYLCDLKLLKNLPPLESLVSSSLHELDIRGCDKHMEKLMEPHQRLLRQKRDRLRAEELCAADYHKIQREKRARWEAQGQDELFKKYILEPFSNNPNIEIDWVEERESLETMIRALMRVTRMDTRRTNLD